MRLSAGIAAKEFLQRIQPTGRHPDADYYLIRVLGIHLHLVLLDLVLKPTSLGSRRGYALRFSLADF